MSIHVHIERLILDGLPLTHGQGAGVQAAVETELARLLGAAPGGISPAWRAGGAIPSLRAGALSLAATGSPTQIGRQIAGALVNALAPETSESVGGRSKLPDDHERRRRLPFPAGQQGHPALR